MECLLCRIHRCLLCFRRPAQVEDGEAAAGDEVRTVPVSRGAPLLDALAQLPEVPPRPLMKRVPHKCRDRWSVLFASLVRKTLACDATANALLRAAPLLLFRNWDHDTIAPPEQAWNKTQRMIEQRLDEAEGESWHQLIADALADVERCRASPLVREERTTHHRHARAARQYFDGDMRSALRSFQPDGVLPANAATLELTHAKFARGSGSLASADQLVARAHKQKPVVPTMQQVETVVERLRPGKAGGGSGWRNGHVVAAIGQPAGLQAMRSWCSAWCAGSFSFRDSWATALSLPLAKVAGEHTDVRNILVGEPLLRVASQVGYDAVAKKALAVILPSKQYAMGSDSGGAAALLARAQAAAGTMGPEACAVSTDIENAFGQIRRAEVLEQVIAVIPENVSFLALLWSHGSRVLQEVEAGSYASFLVTDGLYQGCSWSALCFCLGMLKVSDQFRREAREAGVPVELFLFLDDLLLLLSQSAVPFVIAALERALASIGLALKKSKSFGMLMREDAPMCAEFASTGLTQTWGALRVLGSSLHDDVAASIGLSGGALVGPDTLKRVERADGAV